MPFTTKSLFLATLFLFMLCAAGCKPKTFNFEDNTPPAYDGVPSIVIDAYVNRMWIDLMGREPLTSERDEAREELRAGALSIDTRKGLIDRLRTNGSGGVDYPSEYYHKLALDLNARFLEGASMEQIADQEQQYRGFASQDSADGNMLLYQFWTMEADKLGAIPANVIRYRLGEIDFGSCSKTFAFNGLYDEINMNSFNFINATYDDFYSRFPTAQEFELAYGVIEYGEAAGVMGMAATDKSSFLDALIGNAEFDEGTVRWSYTLLMAREPTSAEVILHIETLGALGDFRLLQREILSSDEYADL
jgi:hypothetical protein